VVDVDPPRPVWAWIRTLNGRGIRARCAAIAATNDAVLIEWGSGQAKTAAWAGRAAVKHRPQLTVVRYSIPPHSSLP
jgi:hypothetical protein